MYIVFIFIGIFCYLIIGAAVDHLLGTENFAMVALWPICIFIYLAVKIGWWIGEELEKMIDQRWGKS